MSPNLRSTLFFGGVVGAALAGVAMQIAAALINRAKGA